MVRPHGATGFGRERGLLTPFILHVEIGLAKLLEPADPSPEDTTLTARPSTEEGAIVGTAPYMSPEQAEGLTPGKSGLAKKSFALIDHLRSVDKRRVRSVFGELAGEEIAAIDEGLAVFLGLGGRLNGAGPTPVR